MVINEAWAEIIGASPARMNAMTVVAYTGAQISTLSSSAVDGQVVFCYSTGSGYTRGHWYGWDDQLSGGTWVDLVALPSNYNFYGDVGLLHEGMVIDRRSPVKEQFWWDNSGTGAGVTTVNVDNSLQWVELATGTTSTGYAVIGASGPQLDWGKPMILKVKFKTSTGAATGQINKLGVNIDRAGLGPSTRRNFGIEWCDGDTSFQIHSGNGSAQSNFDTGITVTTDATWEADRYFDPGNEVRVEFDDGTTVTEKIKTTNIPSSGDTTEDGLMKFSIINNAGNTTSRLLKIRAAYLVASTSDSWWS